MRITILNQYYAPDVAPTARLAASLAEHRALRGDQVTVIASRRKYAAASPDPDPSADQGNPRIHRIWSTRRGGLLGGRLFGFAIWLVLALWRVVRLPAQDVVICMTTPPMLSFLGVVHKCLHPKTRLMLWNMDSYPDVLEMAGLIRRNSLPSRLLQFLQRLMFRWMDHVICLDGAMARSLAARYAPRNGHLPITVIPNWERAADFPPVLEMPRWEGINRPELQDRFIILYMGNAGRGHRFETVIDAADRLRDTRATFLFVGGGTSWARLEEEKSRRNLSNVQFQPYVPEEDRLKVLKSADCGLITLGEEALGVMSPSKIHSKLAMGLPLVYVGPESSNVDEAITRFGCGASFRPGEADALAVFLRRLMNDADFRSHIQLQSRHAFEQAYCDLQTLPKFDAVLAGPSLATS